MKKNKQKMSCSMITLLVIIAFFLGYVFAGWYNAEPEMKMDDHEHATDLPHSHGEHHMHADYNVAQDGLPTPTVDLMILEDPKSGWNLHIMTENFEFDPESASLDHEAGKGHAHLYIDGEKITRLYSNWFHVPELTKGEHVITVDLNTNDHNRLVSEGQPIEDTETLLVE